MKNNNDFDIKGAIILVGVLLGVVLLIYGLTLGAQKLGWFDLGYVKPELETPVISYESILSGTIFDREDDEYYVLIADFDSDDNIYVSNLASMYSKKEDKINMYAVNLSEGLNKSIIGEEGNESAQSVEELFIAEATLIKISNGRNVKYIVGEEDIKEELDV